MPRGAAGQWIHPTAALVKGEEPKRSLHLAAIQYHIFNQIGQQDLLAGTPETFKPDKGCDLETRVLDFTFMITHRSSDRISFSRCTVHVSGYLVSITERASGAFTVRLDPSQNLCLQFG